MRAIVFIGSGKVSYGKRAQALDHGALTVQIAGDFDDAMARVQQVRPARLPRPWHIDCRHDHYLEAKRSGYEVAIPIVEFLCPRRHARCVMGV